jgi:hypothetical protein
VIAIGVIVTIAIMHKQIQSLTGQLSVSISNEKAYAAENSDLNLKNRVFQFTIDQLQYSNDSLNRKIMSVVRENDIKDRNIRSLQYQLEHFSKTDTIVLRDTIFRDPEFRLDTCIMDEWNTSCISLAYPGQIGISNSYVNEKYIIVNSKKEPIRPHKCKFVNFFRKKHTVLEIDVIDKNPYVETERQRFIEIID